MRLDIFETKNQAIDWIQKNVPQAATRSAAESYLRNRLPKESYYQAQIIKALKKEYPQGFIWKAAAGPYSRQGIPDVCAIINGHYFGFEVKRPYIGLLSEIQRATIQEIRRAGGTAETVCFPEDALKIIADWRDNEQKQKTAAAAAAKKRGIGKAAAF